MLIETSTQTSRSSTTKPLLTPKEFYEALGRTVGLNMVYGLVKAGRIKHVLINTKILIPHQEVWEWPAREAYGPA